MKILSTSAICALLIASCLGAGAQSIPLNETPQNQARLFADLPERLRVRISDFESLLQMPLGATVNTFLAPGFNFQGVVVSTSPETDKNIKSVVVRSTNRKGATLTFTQTTKPDGTVRYLGRIISMKNGDAYEVVKEDDQYLLQKRNLADLVVE
ncbi:MAG: hypothetical protein ACXVMS_10830 [Flavisolibacter sp.]